MALKDKDKHALLTYVNIVFRIPKTMQTRAIVNLDIKNKVLKHAGFAHNVSSLKHAKEYLKKALPLL